jgi:hypothetical protein
MITYHCIGESGVTVGGVQETMALLIPVEEARTVEGAAGFALPGWKMRKKAFVPQLASLSLLASRLAV